MNNLLFTAILIALLYYFFYYLPNQKKNVGPANTKPITQDQETQTDELSPKDTMNCPGPQHVQFPSKQVIPNPQEIKQLQTDIQQKEKTIIGLNDSYNKLE